MEFDLSRIFVSLRLYPEGVLGLVVKVLFTYFALFFYLFLKRSCALSPRHLCSHLSEAGSMPVLFVEFCFSEVLHAFSFFADCEPPP